MLKNNITNLLVLFILLTFGQSIHAETKIVISPGILYFDYEETDDDGSFLDGETGPVLGVSGAIEHTMNSGITASVLGGIYSGIVDYDGHTMSGTPVKTETQADFYTLGVAGKFPLNLKNIDINLTAAYLYKRWERDIQSVGNVSGLFEIYEWEELVVGAQLFLDKENNSQWNLQAGIFKTINPDIEIDLVEDGYGKPKLALGTDIGYELAAQWLKFKRNNKDVGFRISYKTWRFGRSYDATISGPGGTGTIHEPKSKTVNILFELMLFLPV